MGMMGDPYPATTTGEQGVKVSQYGFSFTAVEHSTVSLQYNDDSNPSFATAKFPAKYVSYRIIPLPVLRLSVCLLTGSTKPSPADHTDNMT